MLVLIGGAPVSGKTFVAQKLSSEVCIPQLGTELISEWLVSLIGYTAVYGTYPKEIDLLMDANSILGVEIGKNQRVYKAVENFIHLEKKWESYIVEGGAITPEFVNILSRILKVPYRAIMLYEDDPAIIRERISMVKTWDFIVKKDKKKLDTLVEGIILYNQWIKFESQKYQLEIHKSTELDYKYLGIR